MSRRTSAARRYAEAAFELASRDDSFDDWSRDLDNAAALVGDERVTHVLDNPSLPREERETVVGEIFGSHLARPALNLVRLLVDRRRTELLPAIAREYRRLVNTRRGVVEAVVTSAQPLEPDDMQAVRQRIEAMAGSRVDLETRVDPALLGGLTVTIGGRLLDASIRGRLERLRDRLVAGTLTR